EAGADHHRERQREDQCEPAVQPQQPGLHPSLRSTEVSVQPKSLSDRRSAPRAAAKGKLNSSKLGRLRKPAYTGPCASTSPTYPAAPVSRRGGSRASSPVPMTARWSKSTSP